MEPSVKKLNNKISVNKEQIEISESQKQETIESTMFYDVLRMIFQYLSARDLCMVSKLCRSWRDAAKNEIAIRQAPAYIYRKYRVVNRTKVNGFYCALSLSKDLRIVPSFGLICTKVQTPNEWLPMGCYCEYLPKKCSSVMLGGPDIVADNTIIDDEWGNVVTAFLPKIPNLKYEIFHVDNHTVQNASNDAIKSYIDNLLERLLPSGIEKSKCIIMLVKRKAYKFTEYMIEKLQECYEPGTLSLWGGVCVDLKICKANNSLQKCSKKADWVVISLSSPLLQSWSVVLDSSETEIEMGEKLEKFKKKIRLKKHSLGLMFAFHARINRKEAEIEVFKKVFPNMPLVGLYGYGACGLNTLNTTQERHLQHAFSTIFLILTYQ